MINHKFVDDMGNLIHAGDGSVQMLEQWLYQSEASFAALVADLISVRAA